MVFAAKGGIKNGAEGAVPPQWNGTSYLPRAEPSTRPGGVSRSRTEPWQPRAERPGGWLNPHALTGVSTYGNTGKHRPDPGPDPDRAIRGLVHSVHKKSTTPKGSAFSFYFSFSSSVGAGSFWTKSRVPWISWSFTSSASAAVQYVPSLLVRAA